MARTNQSADPIFTKGEGEFLTEAQLRRAAGGEVALSEYQAPVEENPTESETENDADLKRKFKYPLDLSPNFPARIVFTAIEIEGVDILESAGIKKFAKEQFGVDLDFPVPESKGEEQVDPKTSRELKTGSNTKPKELVSYQNNTGGIPIGSVTLPLMSPLKYSDVARYGPVKLGIVAGAEAALLGSNPFEGASTNAGALTNAASALGAQMLAKNVASIAAAGVGAVSGGAATAILGASAAGGIGEGLEGAVKSATRISSAPNERTVFESVTIREPFTFDFNLVASSQKEAVAIKDIVRFFRQELYPEKIPIGTSGVPLAYKFPNVFDIKVVNRFGDNPGFKIQRCYLQSVQTTYNATATGLYEDGSFIEAQLSLQFVEITALDKGKVRLGY
tara:strand:+ start:12312 stop:13487 length:1176 start_codon:yes stop_codon:yes gene_type:complete